MANLTADELIRADSAFVGNRLLSSFPREARALIEPFGTIVELEPGEMVLKRGEHVHSSLFPIGPTMISMVVELSGNRSIEVTSIGSEGAVGGIISCGSAPAFTRASIAFAGSVTFRAFFAICTAKGSVPSSKSSLRRDAMARLRFSG